MVSSARCPRCAMRRAYSGKQKPKHESFENGRVRRLGLVTASGTHGHHQDWFSPVYPFSAMLFERHATAEEDRYWRPRDGRSICHVRLQPQTGFQKSSD
eukprot:scaffold4248_cov231-Pinguiococcus_pyrenoidosus.AAC.6